MTSFADPSHRALATAASAGLRSSRAELKRRLRTGGLSVLALVIHHPPASADGMAVYDLLLACRGVGPAKAAAVLVEADRMTIHRRVGDLTDRQRTLLASIAARRGAAL